MFWDARISALLCRLMDPGRQGRIRYLPVSTESVRSYVTGVDVAAVEAVVLADGSRAASRSVFRPGGADSKVPRRRFRWTLCEAKEIDRLFSTEGVAPGTGVRPALYTLMGSCGAPITPARCARGREPEGRAVWSSRMELFWSLCSPALSNESVRNNGPSTGSASSIGQASSSRCRRSSCARAAPCTHAAA